jgi:uncharacterized protein (DUF169 family)
MTSSADTLKGLNLQWPAVAIGFLEAPPSGVRRLERPLPAGCAYWKHASEGHVFYTVPEDHYSCPVGAFTHGVTLPETQKKELEGLVGTMIQLEYLSASEIPALPHRQEPLQVAAYAPLDRAPFQADVVMFRGNARQMMLVAEAARSAGIFDGADIMGRPACAMIPQAMASGCAVASFGCIGNRVYTALGDDELYVAVPASGLMKMLERLSVILNANSQLEAFHKSRLA